MSCWDCSAAAVACIYIYEELAISFVVPDRQKMFHKLTLLATIQPFHYCLVLFFNAAQVMSMVLTVKKITTHL
jgi:hypothetical protein